PLNADTTPFHMLRAMALILPGIVRKKAMMSFHRATIQSLTLVTAFLMLSQCLMMRPGTVQLRNRFLSQSVTAPTMFFTASHAVPAVVLIHSHALPTASLMVSQLAMIRVARPTTAATAIAQGLARNAVFNAP